MNFISRSTCVALVMFLGSHLSAQEVIPAGVQSPPVLSPHMPQDVLKEFADGYSQLAATDQLPFDFFSWQSFVALNWPANSDGTPASQQIGTAQTNPRVWQFYATPSDVFGIETEVTFKPGIDGGPRTFLYQSKSDHLTSQSDGTQLNVDDSFLEQTGQPLIDRNLNFVLYDIVLNDKERTYIEHGLATKAGQRNFKGPVSFPKGYYADRTNRT